MLFFVGLFIILGMLKIFTLQHLSGEIYKMSLLEQYKFQFFHRNDKWYQKNDQSFWLGIIFLHLIATYLIVCVLTFITNRLRGKE